MGLLVGIVLAVLGGTLIYSGFNGGTTGYFSLVQILWQGILLKGHGSVGAPLPGEDSKHRPIKPPGTH